MILDFSLVQDRPESFSTALKETNRELQSLAALVWLSNHLPSLLRSSNFSLTLRTLSHITPFPNINLDENKTFSIENAKSTSNGVSRQT
jgi:hypothetical protein